MNGAQVFTVSQAAQIAGVSSGALRMWETQGLISPGRDTVGRRVYAEPDIERLRKIAWWRQRGLNAPAIRRILEDEDYAGLGATAPSAEEAEVLPLRSLRHKAGLTLREFSERSGLSVSFLSAVERGISNASPTAAARIKAALQDAGAVDLQSGQHIHALGSGKRLDVAPGITYEWLSDFSGLMEPQLVTIQPGATSEGTYRHDGEEFLAVLAGQLELTLNSTPQTLTTRHSVHFDSQMPHSWRNCGDTEAEVLWVTTERGVWAGRRRREHSTRASSNHGGEL